MNVNDLKFMPLTIDDIRVYVRKLQTLIVIQELIEKLVKDYKIKYSDLLEIFTPLIDFLDIKL